MNEAPILENTIEREKASYDAVASLRRDFEVDEGFISRDPKTGEALLEDRDLGQIMGFYQKAITPGTLLNMGAGPNHLHYMAAVQEKLTHIAALDLSQKNLDVVQNFLDVSRRGSHSEVGGGLNNNDVEVLRIIAEVQSKKKGEDAKRAGEQIMDNLYQKSIEGGTYDLVQGNMYDLDAALHDRKFDNIMISFAIYANKKEELPGLFQGVYKHLNKGGRIIIADFEGFDAEDVHDEFAEDDIVVEQYPDAIALTKDMLVHALEEGGFDVNKIKAGKRHPKEGGAEDEFDYLFVQATR